MEMSVRCKKCNCPSLEEIKVLNPDTTDMNMDAILKCSSCGHEVTYEISSNFHNKRYLDGFVR